MSRGREKWGLLQRYRETKRAQAVRDLLVLFVSPRQRCPNRSLKQFAPHAGPHSVTSFLRSPAGNAIAERACVNGRKTPISHGASIVGEGYISIMSRGKAKSSCAIPARNKRQTPEDIWSVKSRCTENRTKKWCARDAARNSRYPQQRIPPPHILSCTATDAVKKSTKQRAKSMIFQRAVRASGGTGICS